MKNNINSMIIYFNQCIKELEKEFENVSDTSQLNYVSGMIHSNHVIIEKLEKFKEETLKLEVKRFCSDSYKEVEQSTLCYLKDIIIGDEDENI